MKAWKRAALAVMTSMLASGAFAAGGRQVARRAVLTNLAYERAQNEVLLLNILRARDRMPLYYTTMPSTTSTLQRGPSLSFTGPIGNGNGTGAGTAAFGFGNTTQVTTQNQVTQEFMMGVMAPMKPELLSYYLEQGWPADFVLHMALRGLAADNHPRICKPACTEDAKLTCPQMAEYLAFSSDLRRRLKQSGFEAKVKDVGVSVALGPRFDLPAGAAALDGELIASLTALPTAKLKLLSCTTDDEPCAPTGFQLASWKPSWIIEFPSAAKKRPPRSNPCKGLDPCPSISTESIDGIHIRTVEDQAAPADGDEQGTGPTTMLRSPEAMIYYLGQIARLTTREAPAAADVRSWPRIQPYSDSNACEPLFVLLPDDGECEAQLRVRYRGESFIVPRKAADAKEEDSDCDSSARDRCDPGQTTRALSFLTQLLQLQQSSKDLPQAVTINVANP